jgi:hypothetical protein
VFFFQSIAVFPNQGSAEHRGTNKNFEIPQKIPIIPRNIAGIFVRQLAILE